MIKYRYNDFWLLFIMYTVDVSIILSNYIVIDYRHNEFNDKIYYNYYKANTIIII